MAKLAVFKGLDKSLRKQKVIDTAVAVFHEKGYRASTLDDVAGELGVTRAALYHYFSSKEKLLSAIYLQALESFFAGAYKVGASDLSPQEKLRAFVNHNIRHVIIDHLAMFSVFFSEESELPDLEAKRIKEEKRKYTQVVEKILEEGVESGAFRGIDPKLGAYAILGMCNWIYKWYTPRPGSIPVERIVESFIGLMETGLLAGTGDRAREAAPNANRVAASLRKQADALRNLAEELEPTSTEKR